jgi:hypothetical protein
MSVLRQIYDSCGLFYSALLCLSFAGALALQAALVWRARSRRVRVLVFLAALAPLCVGISGTLDSLLASALVIAGTPVAPTPDDFARGTAVILVSTYVGAALTIICLAFAIPGFGRSAPRPQIRCDQNDRQAGSAGSRL